MNTVNKKILKRIIYLTLPLMSIAEGKAQQEDFDQPENISQKLRGEIPLGLGSIDGVESGALDREIAHLHDEVIRLKAIIETLREQLRVVAEGAAPANSDIQNTYNQLRAYLEDPGQNPSFRGGENNLQSFLIELLNQDDSDNAIEGFMKVIRDVLDNTQDRDRNDRITKAFQDLYQDQRLNSYNANMVKKQLKDTQHSSIYPLGKQIISRLPTEPNVQHLKICPLLMLYYTDRDKAGPYWQTEVIPQYRKLIRYASLDDVKAAYTVLTTKPWNILHNPEDKTGNQIQLFLQECYERIISEPAHVPLDSEAIMKDINDFIDARIKKDLKLDFIQLENNNIENLKSSYDKTIGNIASLKEEKPMMAILTYDLNAWNALSLSRADYDKLIDLLRYLSTEELKSILYHLSSIHLMTQSDNKDDHYFYKSLSQEVTARPDGFFPRDMSPAIKSEMRRAVKSPLADAPPPGWNVPVAPPPPLLP